MKYLGLLLIVMMLAAGCKNTDQAESGLLSTENISNVTSGDPADFPRFKWENHEFDFGTISQGEKVRYTFKFENAGKNPLVIASVKTSCGCTVIDNWPREPIPSGGKGEIEVEFNSEGKKGNILKNVTIVANTTPSTSVVKMKGLVLAPDSND